MRLDGGADPELRYLSKSQDGFKPFGVGECWDSERTIDDWLSDVNACHDNPVSAFDFPLRYRLKSLSDSYGFSLTGLAAGNVCRTRRRRPSLSSKITTHRDPSNPINNDKMLAYAYILTHDGYPCVFWQD